jgi:hypothetical protein
MKIAVWVVFSVVTLLWTAGTLIAVELTRWGTQLLASGNFEQLSRGVAQWPVPEGLPFWLDPASIRTMQEIALLSLEAFHNALPYASTAMGWLVPVIWVVWGLGLLFLLALAGGTHWLTARHSPVSI